MKEKSKGFKNPERERDTRYPIGRKFVVVWRYLRGQYAGMYQVCCSLYPQLGGLYQEREKALQRAQRIVSFHNRQLEIGGLL